MKIEGMLEREKKKEEEKKEKAERSSRNCSLIFWKYSIDTFAFLFVLALHFTNPIRQAFVM